MKGVTVLQKCMTAFTRLALGASMSAFAAGPIGDDSWQEEALQIDGSVLVVARAQSYGGLINIEAEAGISPIAGLGYQVSRPIDIMIEDQTASDISNPPASRNHSQQVLTHALAIHSLYTQLAPSLSQEQLNALIDASGSGNSTTLEGAFEVLRVLLLGDDNPEWRLAA